VLAHPLGEFRAWPVAQELIRELALAGLAGVEVDHPDQDETKRSALRAVVASLDLVGTGGSDDHGELTGDRIGAEVTGGDEVDRLLSAASGAPVITG
jgi:3',5'-nucleoside bisphosphate phosphatase